MKDEKEIQEKKNEKLDINSINYILGKSKKIAKISYVLIIILALYVLIKLGKELGIFTAFVTLLKVISPLFIGLVIAWLFNPLIKWLGKKKIKRPIATVLVYLVFIGILALILGTIIPTLYDQIEDLVAIIPSISTKIKDWINGSFSSLDGVSGIDIQSVRLTLIEKIEKFGTEMATDLPSNIVNTLSALFSGIGQILVGLIIGFFLLLSFEDSSSLIDFLPKKIKITTKELVGEVDGALRTYITGALLDCALIFVLSSILLYIAGLKAPLLFGLFCGITNIIPYAGPYIGGAPAVIVGFSQGMTTGLISLIGICVIQFVEGNFLQPVILSKTTKLHPVTIIIGLLIFGYLWGMVGMILATPLIAAIKAVVLYFDKKYDILSFK